MPAAHSGQGGQGQGAQLGELGVGDLAAIARRRLWWFVLPTAAGIVLSLGLSLVLPAVYEGEAIVEVEPQGIPDSLVNPTVVASAEDRFNRLVLRILTRDMLSKVIDDLGLFPGEVAPREELVLRMREQITIEPLPPAIVDPRRPVELSSFRIAFRGDDAALVARVANRLADDFIVENLKDRRARADSTSDFLTEELDKQRQRSAQLANEILRFKTTHQGELPENLPMNRQRVERARLDLAAAEARLDEARGQVDAIGKQLTELRIAGSEADNPAVRKQMLELTLNTLLSHGKTEKHPDVVMTRAEIAALERVLASQGQSPTPASPEEQRLRTELRNYQVRAGVYRDEVERLRADIAQLDARLDKTSARAAELTHLETEYANLNDAIRALQLKQIDAELGRSVEISEKGERFRRVEYAAEPEAPVSPNRPLWFAAGTILGVVTGLGLVALREMTDHSFYSVDDLQRALRLPVLAAVPRLDAPGTHV